MEKGIVVEVVKASFILVVTQNGDLVKGSYQTCEIGEEISFNRLSVKDKRSLYFVSKHKYAVSITMAAIMCIFVLIEPIPHKAFAYVSVYTNASIEMTVCDEHGVIELNALNEKGAIVLKSIKKWKGKSSDTVANQILLTSAENGFLTKDRSVLLTTSFTDENINNERREKFNNDTINMYQLLEKENLLIFEKFEIPTSVRDEAIENNLTPVKYIALQNIFKNGILLTRDEVDNLSEADVRSELGGFMGVVEGRVSKESWQKIKDRIIQNSEVQLDAFK